MDGCRRTPEDCRCRVSPASFKHSARTSPRPRSDIMLFTCDVRPRFAEPSALSSFVVAFDAIAPRVAGASLPRLEFGRASAGPLLVLGRRSCLSTISHITRPVRPPLRLSREGASVDGDDTATALCVSLSKPCACFCQTVTVNYWDWFRGKVYSLHGCVYLAQKYRGRARFGLFWCSINPRLASTAERLSMLFPRQICFPL